MTYAHGRLLRKESLNGTKDLTYQARKGLFVQFVTKHCPLLGALDIISNFTHVWNVQVINVKAVPFQAQAWNDSKSIKGILTKGGAQFNVPNVKQVAKQRRK